MKKLATILLVTVLGFIAMPSAFATQDYSPGWYTWEVTNGVTSDHPKDDSQVTYPQKFVGVGKLDPPCGVWYQRDDYSKEGVTSEDIHKVIKDGVLTKGEDYSIVKQWSIVFGGKCEPTPTPTETEPSEQPTSTPTPSVTVSETPTPTPTPSETATESSSPTPTPTPSVTESATPTPTPTETRTVVPTPTVSPSNTPSATETPSETPRATPSATITPKDAPTVRTPEHLQLAYTGFDWQVPVGVAVTLIIVGIIFWLVGRRPKL